MGKSKGLPCRASQVGILRLSGKRFEPSIRKKRKILIPTWVYSCCVRHEENRSENCRIVFPQMGVIRMGYGYCNIIYDQIRQTSLIFFVYLWYHSLRDLHHCSLRLWWRLRHSKKLSEKHNEVTIFETSNFSCLHRCTFLRCASGRRLHSKNFSACPSANRIFQFGWFGNTGYSFQTFAGCRRIWPTDTDLLWSCAKVQ